MDNNYLVFIMLALPALFGLSLVGEGIYRIAHYESGWINMLMGALFLIAVAVGYFYISGFMG